MYNKLVSPKLLCRFSSILLFQYPPSRFPAPLYLPGVRSRDTDSCFPRAAGGGGGNNLSPPLALFLPPTPFSFFPPRRPAGASSSLHKIASAPHFRAPNDPLSFSDYSLFLAPPAEEGWIGEEEQISQGVSPSFICSGSCCRRLFCSRLSHGGRGRFLYFDLLCLPPACPCPVLPAACISRDSETLRGAVCSSVSSRSFPSDFARVFFHWLKLISSRAIVSSLDWASFILFL